MAKNIFDSRYFLIFFFNFTTLIFISPERDSFFGIVRNKSFRNFFSTQPLRLMTLRKMKRFRIDNIGNGSLRKLVTSKNGHFENGSLRKWFTSKMGHFRNASLRKFVTSKIGHFGNEYFAKLVTSQSITVKI